MAQMVNFDIKIDTSKATQEFKEARKMLKRKVKEGLLHAAEDVALPAVKRAVPVKTGRLKRTIKAKATQRRAYIQAGSARAPYAGLLEFGGTSHYYIKPKKKKALLINGEPKAIVKKPRKYAKREYMQGPIRKHQPQIQDAIIENVMEAFSGLDTDTSSAGSSPSLSAGYGGLL